MGMQEQLEKIIHDQKKLERKKKNFWRSTMRKGKNFY